MPRPPKSTRTYSLVSYTTLVRSCRSSSRVRRWWRSPAVRRGWRKWQWPSVLSFFFHVVSAFGRKRDGCGNQCVCEHQLRRVARVERAVVLDLFLVQYRHTIAVDAHPSTNEGTIAALAARIESSAERRKGG